MKNLKLLIGSISLCISAYAGASSDIPISSCAELQNMQLNLTAHYTLTQDINCEGEKFVPINGTFTGILDGANHTISNLTIDVVDGPAAMFLEMNHAVVKSIHFVDATVIADDDLQRSLLARVAINTAFSHITVDNLHVGGPATFFSTEGGEGKSAGIVMYAEHTLFSNIHLNHVKLKVHTFAGGLAAYVTNCQVSNSSVNNIELYLDRSRDIELTTYVGGLFAAVVTGETEIESSSVTGTLNAPSHVGGLIGVIDRAIVNIYHSYANVNIAAQHQFGGGIVGHMTGSPFIRLKNVYAAGHVEGEKTYGILGTVQGNDPKPYMKCYETYYDKTLSGKKHSGTNGAKGLTTEEMTQQNEYTFAVDQGWSRDFWIFPKNEYPTLRVNE